VCNLNIVHLNVLIALICNILDSYESGVSKVKLAEQFSDIDSSDIDNTEKKNRRSKAKKFDSDEDDDERNIRKTHGLPPPPRKPNSKALPIINSNYKPMEVSMPLENNTTKEKRSNDSTLRKNLILETSVSKNNKEMLPIDTGMYKIFVYDIYKLKLQCKFDHSILYRVMRFCFLIIYLIKMLEFQKELFRKLNRIDARLDRIDDRVKNIEEKLESGISHTNKEYFDISEIASFPLKTKEDLEKLEVDLQDADFFKNMVRCNRHYITRFMK